LQRVRGLLNIPASSVGVVEVTDRLPGDDERVSMVAVHISSDWELPAGSEVQL
jgi:hypothetical protein